MATILLSAVGAALGGGLGSGLLGLSGAVLGKAAGAAIGRAIDQRLLGGGSAAVEVGKVERFSLMGASEGAAIPRIWGRFRLGGQVIWATQFREDSETHRGGKGGATGTKYTEYSYSISLAIGLCEGPVLAIERVWADGNEIRPDSLTLRLHDGAEDQLPDAKIEAVEGAGNAPAYRGLAYVVIEDLDLGRFGNRVPQFSFEVIRAGAEGAGLAPVVQAVALIPGTGEYALATSTVRFADGPGRNRAANVHTVSGSADLLTSLKQMRAELPQVGAVSLVAAWFGDDLRCGQCRMLPMVEQASKDGDKMPWRVAGLTRSTAEVLPQLDGRVIYGGTPADASLIEAIAALKSGGQEVMFYPFLLMRQLAGNARPDPWSPEAEQPVLPWRGRITASLAPGVAGGPDGTSAAEAEVAAFFGAAEVADFSIVNGAVSYAGVADWGYRRFVLHYAKLCQLAGGVEAFCIGSELRGLLQIRGAGGSFPGVAQMVRLAADVRAILGPQTKISYAADWSEYFGYHVGDDVYFHLDPLWSDANIDFIGIDNYMPVSDWRDGLAHADAAWGAGHHLAYLAANVAGGEGYDWYYDSEEGAEAQRRLPITDGAHGEAWVFRFKDLRSWWGNAHHNRIGGVRSATPTAWQPGSKPIWFTEYGCPAIDKGTNQPNRFVDPKSSESGLPRGSNGNRDDFIQMQYFRAVHAHWADPANNPTSALYGGPMVDMAHAFAWAWDARPFPTFPTRSDLWSDGENYRLGHWLNGRAASQALPDVVAEICAASGVQAEVSDLAGVVRGYALPDVMTARSALQPLGLAYGFDGHETAGRLSFTRRHGLPLRALADDALASTEDLPLGAERMRSPAAELGDQVLVSYVEDQSNFGTSVAGAGRASDAAASVDRGELGLVLLPGEARMIAERWLTEARIARDSLRLCLPASQGDLAPGAVLAFDEALYRIDRIERGAGLVAEAVRVEPSPYALADLAADARVSVADDPAAQPMPLFLDLPLLTGAEKPHAPHVAVAASPWPGPVAIWEARADDGFTLNSLVTRPAIVGETQSVLKAAPAGLPDRGPALRIRLGGGALDTLDWADVLDGGNLLAIGSGQDDLWEVFQFTRADLIAPYTYDLSLRLRGQFGTDALMPAEWPVGSLVVRLDPALVQLSLAEALRGAERSYRTGVAALGYADADVVTSRRAFAGVGLRPYSPVHLRQTLLPDGSLRFGWVRRTRQNGDSWLSLEVPLAEAQELYLVRLVSGSTLLFETMVSEAQWIYSPAAQAEHAGHAALTFEVAQLSDTFGPGPFARIVQRS